MNASLRVLCLDIEGGFGGSSRSLYESIRHLNRRDVAIEVWCRRDGPVRLRYEALGVACRIVPGLPSMNSLPRWSRNLYGNARCLMDLLHWKERTELLREIKERFDLVHFNHEGLWLVAAWLRKRHDKTQTMHVRTLIPDNAFGHWQCRRMASAIDQFAFITENENRNVERQLNTFVSGSVIYNIVARGTHNGRHLAVPDDSRLKVAVLSNFALVRGTDRVVDIAEALAERGRRDVLFVLAGDMTLSGSLPGELGRIARPGGTLADHAMKKGVADMFIFLGHVAVPETVLAACDVLLKPTREDNPWGRDILEGLANGLPVISIGNYNRFVETNATGFLLSEYSSHRVAEILIRLDADRELTRKLGNNAMARIASLCNPEARAADLLALWRKAITMRERKMAV